MPRVLSLHDLVAPYLLRGADRSVFADLLQALQVERFEAASDPRGTIIRGRVRLAEIVPIITPPTFGIRARALPPGTTGRNEWLDIRDSSLDFSLVVPHAAAALVVAAPPPAVLGPVLAALDALPGDAPPSDYPGADFALDLLVTAAVLRPPGLIPAKLLPDGRLRADEAWTGQVTFTLPRLRLRIRPTPMGGNPAAGMQLGIDLLSLGAAGLDDPSAIGVVQGIEMQPPHALLFADASVGFSFRGAILDLDDGATPPQVLAKFGFGEGWRGLYLPEVRLHVAPEGLEGIAVSAFAQDLLIGFGEHAGVSGDFGVTAVEQGAGELVLGARFAVAGRPPQVAVRTGSVPFAGGMAVTARAELPGDARMVVDVQGGRATYVCTVSVDGGAGQPGRLADIAFAGAPRRAIQVTVTDGSTPARSATLLIEAVRVAPRLVAVPGGGPGQPGQAPEPAVEITASNPVGLRLRIAGRQGDEVIITLDPPDDATSWTVDGAARPPARSTRVTVPPEADIAIAATRRDGGAAAQATVYWRWNRPRGDDEPDYAVQPGNTNQRPAVFPEEESRWSDGGSPILQPGSPLALRLEEAARQAAGGGQLPLNLIGFASWDGDDSRREGNRLLSDRRAEGVARIVEARWPGRFQIATTGRGFEDSRTIQQTDPASPMAPRNLWWRTDLDLPAVPTQMDVQGRLRRGAVPKSWIIVEPPDQPPAQQPAPPDWFRSAKVKARLLRNRLIALEIEAEIDIETGLEQRMRTLAPPMTDLEMRRLGSNPSDGILRLQVLAQQDPTTGLLRFTALAGADPADRDGLLMAGWLPGEPRRVPGNGAQYIGLLSTFLPVLSNTVPSGPQAGALADIANFAAVTLVPIAVMPFLTVERVVLHGIEVRTEQRPAGTTAAFLFDVETALSADLGLVRISQQTPLSVRYKAIGVMGGTLPGENAFTLRPVFDASRGYTIDVSRPGTLQVREPLGNILKVLGARVARTNPLSFEVDVGIAADLGVVSVDRARVRLLLDPPPLGVELTALGVTVDVPGVLLGRGELAIGDGKIEGALDVTLRPLGLRIAARLRVEKLPDRSATAVAVSLEVEFPVAIPLWSSGLGIYGFSGLFASHFRRDEAGGRDATAVLRWLRERANGDPANLAAWTPEFGRWAFGLGMLLGTMEGGVLFNLKGMLLLELPGPRILLCMNARLLTVPPAVKGKDPGGALVMLAVIDIDVEQGTISIGLTIEYEVRWLLRIFIPVSAIFSTKDPANWQINLGRYPKEERAQARVFEFFDGSAYLMLSGNGLKLGDVAEVKKGFAVGTGVHVALVWGSTSIGLYARVAGGLDALVGFDPFRFTAKLRLEGELRLFIVGIGASTDLDVLVGEVLAPDGTPTGERTARIQGKITGRVRLLFVKLEGSVEFAIGASSVPDWTPPPLVEKLVIASRSPALAIGTALDRPVDARLDETKPVPVDCIPVLLCPAPPWKVGPVLGAPPTNMQGGASDGWVQRGPDRVQYELLSVELVGSALSAGDTPSVWWRRGGPDEAEHGVELALLTWVPTPAPKAIEYGERLTRDVFQRWGRSCVPPAEPAFVLWTFAGQPVGADPRGWMLRDGIAWPDAPGTIRSTPPDLVLPVRETWRCGDEEADTLRGVEPAAVVAAGVRCPVFIVQRLCIAQVLAAPALDGPEPIGLGFPADAPRVEAAWQAIGFVRPVLHDAIRLATGPAPRLRLLLLVPARLLRPGHVRLRVLRPDGTEAFARAVTLADTLALANAPPRWTDQGGPWAGPVALAAAYADSREGRLADLVPVLVELDASEAGEVEIGIPPEVAGARDPEPFLVPPFFLAAVEALRLDEIARAEFDREVVVRDRAALEAALGPKSGRHALLAPDSDYQVVVKWGARRKVGDPLVERTQSFAFRTDAAPPPSLSPYLLAAHPAPEERHVFGGGKLSLVLATTDVVDIWARYGQALRVRLKAASARPPGQPPLAPHPIDTGTVTETVANVLSPWERAIMDLGLGCVVADGERKRHAEVMLPFDLDPLTDYLLDVEAVAPDGAVRRVLRHGFSTSAYATAADYARALLAAEEAHHVVKPGSLQGWAAGLGGRAPEGAEMERALEAAGLDAPEVPRFPRVTVLWEAPPGEEPQPAAVLVDAPEPLWRSRALPRIATDAETGNSRVVMAPVAWLLPVEVDGALAAQVVPAPGGQRALVTLKPGSRGAALRLALRTTDLANGKPDGADAPVTESLAVVASLRAAPWEEDAP